MYIMDNTDYFLDNETIIFEILQNLWVHIDFVNEGTNYINKRWYI